MAAIALPVGIAYADLAGVPAVIGMYSAILPLLVYALFGSSRQLMTGPDAATCIIVAHSLAPLAGGDPQRYLALMVILTLMTGILYVIAGLFRLGFIANFLSQPILTGYLNGIALIIIVGQFQKLFGYSGEADEFFSELAEISGKLDQFHLPTLGLSIGLLLVLIILRRVAPRLPAALIVVVAGIASVVVFDLDQNGVAVLGNVPAGLPSFPIMAFEPNILGKLLFGAAGIALVSFTSGVMTAKSFARRNRYEVNTNQELIAFGASNIVTGLGQGFPVTGADSRTAVNDAMGGKTQLVGIVAAGSMLLILFFLTEPLGFVPTAALAAVIMVAAVGLFDFTELRNLYETSYRELLLSVSTTLGVLILGVLPGVLLAVALTMFWLLAVVSHPHDEVLGQVKGMKGFHGLEEFPEATTIPGLVIYRFDASLIFFNADFFVNRVRATISAAKDPVEWFLLDASPINIIDLTAFQKLVELREELAAKGIMLALARAKPNLWKFFNQGWALKRRKADAKYHFDTINTAVCAFSNRVKEKATTHTVS